MTDQQLNNLIREAVQERDETKANALLAQINAELARRGQLYTN